MTLDDCDDIFGEALRSPTEASFCHVVSPLLEHYQMLSVAWGRGSIFWRARIVHDIPFANLSAMVYSPKQIVGVGRLNDQGSPCFYISARKETAIAEVGVEEGKIIQLAGFRILDANPVRLALIGEYSNVQKVGYMHFGGIDPGLNLSKALNEMPRREALRMMYIDKFFAHVLADPHASNKGYLMSRALAQVIYTRSKADGIVFPSVKDQGGFNIGIKPDVSDKCFHNVCCIVVRLGRKRKFGLLDFEVIKAAKMLDTEFNFVWDDSLIDGRLGLYGMSKKEYDVATSSPDDKNALLNIFHQGRRS